ncbi:DNA polymerase III subunit chi [Afifella sp. YEN Y35]|uniref:DNA polymerase III subunit chi n=1 Tax=Afifella sp. YEN Y35 TaxID=3388337 RepID=UPI0039E0DC68
MPEILFYHLETRPLDKALPDLLQRSLDRGWRAVVQAGSEERLASLDAALWTFDDASFLPHGMAEDGRPEDQPVFLTTKPENPNGAAIRFLLDCAEEGDFSSYQRVVYLFEAANEATMQWARQAWKRLKAEGAEMTYWKQDSDGRWNKQG